MFLCIVYILTLSVSSRFEDYFQLLELNNEIGAKAAYYNDAGDMGREKYTIVTYLMGIFPYLIYPLVSLFYLKRKRYLGAVMRLEPFLLIGVMFLVIEMVILRANRFVDYYRVYFALFYAEFFIYLIKDKKSVNRKFKAYAVFTPLFLLLLFGVIKGESWRYFPYSTIIEKTVVLQREKKRDGASPANPNEY